MKYNVRKKFKKLIVTFEAGIEYLNENNFAGNPAKEFLFKASVVNSIWQAWSLFWRTYWLAEILGGVDIQNKVIAAMHPGMSEEEAVNFLFTKNVGGRKRRSEEKGWGDVAVLTLVARLMYEIDGSIDPTLSISKKAQNISSAVSLLGNSVNHLQIIRNCSIHLHEYNLQRSLVLASSYVAPSIKYPTDLLFAPTLTDGKKAILSWYEEIVALLSFVE